MPPRRASYRLPTHLHFSQLSADWLLWVVPCASQPSVECTSWQSEVGIRHQGPHVHHSWGTIKSNLTFIIRVFTNVMKQVYSASRGIQNTGHHIICFTRHLNNLCSVGTATIYKSIYIYWVSYHQCFVWWACSYFDCTVRGAPFSPYTLQGRCIQLLKTTSSEAPIPGATGWVQK
jgi:hypothetical protein